MNMRTLPPPPALRPHAPLLPVLLFCASLLLSGCLGSPAPIQNSSGGYAPAQAANQNYSSPAANASAPTTPDSSANGSVIVYFFYLSTCPFCNKQINLANGALKAEFPQVVWKEYEVSSPANRALWVSMMGARNSTAKSVPITIIGQDIIDGYYPGQTEAMIRASIKEQLRQKNLSE
jgi:hypothetical protein